MELTLDQALQKGIEAHKAGQVQEADRYYTAILKANPKHPDANHNLGVLAVGVGKVEEALPFFKTALEVNPSITQYWLSYIDALIKLNRMADAKEVFDQAKNNDAKGDGFDQIEKRLGSSAEVKNQIQEEISTFPNILDELTLDKALKFANKKVKDGLSEEAKKIYKDILAKFPRNKKALDGIRTLSGLTTNKTSSTPDPPQEELQSIVYLYTQGQYQGALDKASQLLEQFPNSVNLYNIIGASNKGLGKLDEAIEAYNKALSIKPDFAETHYNMGNALKDQGNLEKAVEAYRKTISIKPEYFKAYGNMGNALKDRGKLEEAIEAYNKALSIKPDYPDAYNNMGNALKEQGKLEEAIEAYNKALSINPDYAEAYSNMGNALKEQGKLEEALEALNKALLIMPDFAEAYNNMGSTLEEQGRLDEAIKTFTKALSIMPDNSNAIVNASALRNQLSDTALINKELERRLDTHQFYLIEMPKFQIHRALRAFLLNDQQLVRKHLNIYSSCSKSSIAKMVSKDQVFCSAYNHFLQKLIDTPFATKPAFADHQTVFHLGESHCLSYAHRLLKLHSIDFNIVPRITFGGKAYHFSTEKESAHKAITKSNFDSLPDGSKVFVSFGEIDCRPNEGFIPAAEKLNTPIEDLVSDTVRGYVGWFLEQNQTKNHSLFFFNVPAPIYNEIVSEELNKEVAKTVKLFNDSFCHQLATHELNLIDVYKFTIGNNLFSNGSFHIDNYHLSSYAIPEIEQQINN